jgi:hypothetical protein
VFDLGCGLSRWNRSPNNYGNRGSGKFRAKSAVESMMLQAIYLLQQLLFDPPARPGQSSGENSLSLVISSDRAHNLFKSPELTSKRKGD